MVIRTILLPWGCRHRRIKLRYSSGWKAKMAAGYVYGGRTCVARSEAIPTYELTGITAILGEYIDKTMCDE